MNLELTVSRAMQAQRWVRGWRFVPDAFWMRQLLAHGLWPGNFRLDGSGSLTVPGLGFPVTKSLAAIVLPSVANIEAKAPQSNSRSRLALALNP